MKYDLNKMPLTQIWKAIATDDELRLTIAENMEQYGGSFVKALGQCLLLADRENRYKLAQAFTNYMLEYQPSKWNSPDNELESKTDKTEGKEG